MQEPFVDVILELTWSTGRLVREYTLLFDPPASRTAPPAPAPAPSRRRSRPRRGAAAPAPAGPAAGAGAKRRAPRRRRARRAPPRRVPTDRARRPSPVPRRPARRAASGEYRVAGRHAVAHRRAHPARQRVARPDAGRAVPQQPGAFIGDNMNRLKAGAVLPCRRPTRPQRSPRPRRERPSARRAPTSAPIASAWRRRARDAAGPKARASVAAAGAGLGRRQASGCGDAPLDKLDAQQGPSEIVVIEHCAERPGCRRSASARPKRRGSPSCRRTWTTSSACRARHRNRRRRPRRQARARRRPPPPLARRRRPSCRRRSRRR